MAAVTWVSNLLILSQQRFSVANNNTSDKNFEGLNNYYVGIYFRGPRTTCKLKSVLPKFSRVKNFVDQCSQRKYLDCAVGWKYQCTPTYYWLLIVKNTVKTDNEN